MLLFIVLILLSGVWLFGITQGWEVFFERWNVAMFWHKVEMPSWHGLIEIATPHLWGMGMTLFVTAHFLLFGERFSQRKAIFMSFLLFGLMFMDIFAYLPSLLGFDAAALKPLFMFLFVAAFLVLEGLLWWSL